jgi:phosphoribosylformimino-5-aminoimidazole carboxamide ribotide isomerase
MAFVDQRVELGEWVNIPCTYAGGAKSKVFRTTMISLTIVGIDDLDLVHRLSKGKVDLTYGR